MNTSVLTPLFFNLSYFIPLILLAITLCARHFNGDPKGMPVRVSARKLGDVTGKAMSVLRYCNNEDVEL